MLPVTYIQRYFTSKEGWSDFLSNPDAQVVIQIFLGVAMAVPGIFVSMFNFCSALGHTLETYDSMSIANMAAAIGDDEDGES